MGYRAVRVLRTPHSERHLIVRDQEEVAAVDLHYLLDGRVAGTLTVFESAKLTESDVPALLAFIDEDLLPEVTVGEGNLIFTGVIGRVLGSFTHDLTGTDLERAP